MKLSHIMLFPSLILLISCADNKGVDATPSEVIAKVRKAALLIEDKGLEGLEVLRDPHSEFSWKDTYVFSFNCAEDKVLANAAFPDKVGGDIKQHTDYNGFRYGLKMCEESDSPNGVWVEYIWPKPSGGQPLRKISYVLTVKNLNIQVGAGIYNEEISMTELNQLIQ